MRRTANRLCYAREGRRTTKRSEGGRPRASGYNSSFEPRVCNSHLSLCALPALTRDCSLVSVCVCVKASEYGCRPDFTTNLQVVPSTGLAWIQQLKTRMGVQVILDFFVLRFALVTIVRAHRATRTHSLTVTHACPPSSSYPSSFYPPFTERRCFY